MAARDSAQGRSSFETLALAGLGALALAAERVDELANELAGKFDVDRDAVRTTISDALESWRREAHRLGESSSDAASRLAADLGIASLEAVKELELRVAQLEHRLKLLERK
ncbi:MAG TPA: hypothetical protein VI540_07985 [Gaiellaceae bacterium]|nr:hypothetical protein [Gaiellaceae bacterium]